MIAGEKMDGILWLDEQESAEFEKILANLQPNRSTREEFMRISSSEDSGFMFRYHEERIKVSFSSDGAMTVMAKGTESEEWYIPEIKWELVLIYGVTAEEINDERNAAFMHYKIALMREIKLKK